MLRDLFLNVASWSRVFKELISTFPHSDFSSFNSIQKKKEEDMSLGLHNSLKTLQLLYYE